VVLAADPKRPHVIANLAAELPNTNLLLVSIRRRALPAGDLAAIRKYLAAGKPLLGIRTANHAFDARGKGPAGPAHQEWPEFDAEVLGGHYTGHHGTGPKVIVAPAPGAEHHPILAEVRLPLMSPGSLYKVSPLSPSATPLLVGRIQGKPVEPVAWINRHGKGRIFYTSLGHPDDFEDAAFVRLLANAVQWGLGVEEASPGKKP
jgi:hypothetical protein